MVDFIERLRERKVDTLVFLDKSARPLSWLFRAAWKKADLGPIPDVKFMNIGQATELRTGAKDLLAGDRFGAGLYDAEREQLDARLWSSSTKDKWLTTKDIPARWAKGLLQRDEIVAMLADTFENQFDGKSVVVVDEFASSGRSQIAAMGLLALAFPRMASVQATSFFVDKDDYRHIFWHEVAGFTDVIEGSDPLFASSITDSNIQRIREQHEDRGTSVMPSWLHESAEDLRARSTKLRADMELLADEVARELRHHGA